MLRIFDEQRSDGRRKRHCTMGMRLAARDKQRVAGSELYCAAAEGDFDLAGDDVSDVAFAVPVPTPRST